MRDAIRKSLVVGVFFAAIAGVWTLGAVKADLDGPSGTGMRVDPALVRAALLADPTVDPDGPEARAQAQSHLTAS